MGPSPRAGSKRREPVNLPLALPRAPEYRRRGVWRLGIASGCPGGPAPDPAYPRFRVLVFFFCCNAWMEKCG